jgi:hypothetical protein
MQQILALKSQPNLKFPEQVEWEKSFAAFGVASTVGESS